MMQIYGYPGRHHRGGMPEFGPDLGGGMTRWTNPDGTETDTPRDLVALVDWLETIQQPEP